MTIKAHGTRQVYSGATRYGGMESPQPGPRFSLHRELHPQMYKNNEKRSNYRNQRLTAEECKDLIIGVLREHGPRTSAQIAGILKIHAKRVWPRLEELNGGPEGVVGEYKIINGKRQTIWRINGISQ